MAKDKAYRKAEKKIEEALQSGATELDLNGIGLTELPPDLWKLKNIKVLKLGFEHEGKQNQLIELPKEIGQFTQLQKLDLSYNQLMVLPDSLGQLTQLQWLALSDNRLTTLPESLRQLTQLQSLYLSYNQQIVLPEWLGQLTPNCITENVTLRSIVAPGKMLLSDRRTSQSEEQHDEPEEQARVVRSRTATLPESRESGKAKDVR